MTRHLFVLSGNIAVGKTTLGSRLAKRLGAEWLAETELSMQFPHLIAKDTPRAKVATEIAFAALRAALLMSRFLGGARVIVSERSLWDDWIFFQVWRDRYKLEEHESFMAQLFERLVPEPLEYTVHTVILDSATDPLVGRALRRNQPYDHIFTDELITDIERHYANALVNPPRHVIGRINVSNLDITDADGVEAVLSRLDGLFRPFIEPVTGPLMEVT